MQLLKTLGKYLALYIILFIVNAVFVPESGRATANIIIVVSLIIAFFAFVIESLCGNSSASISKKINDYFFKNLFKIILAASGLATLLNMIFHF